MEKIKKTQKTLQKTFIFLVALLLAGIFSFVYAGNLDGIKSPHYMQDLGLTKCGAVKDMFELRKLEKLYLSQTRQMWNEEFSKWPQDLGEGLWADRVVYQKRVRIYFRDYRLVDNKYYFVTARGMQQIKKEDFEYFADFVAKYLQEGVDNVWETYSEFVPVKNDPELNKEIQVKPGTTVTLRDLLFLPAVYEKFDFVPDEVYITPMEPWGMVYLSFYRGGISRVFLHPEAILDDCLYGKPIVVNHELAHNQNSLQWLPLGGYVDFEIMAELASGGMYNTFYWELLHPYFLPLADVFKAFFGFDYKESGTAFDFISTPTGIRWTNPDRMKKYQAEWEKIRTVLVPWIKNYFNEFYKDPLFAVSMNMNLCWDNAFFATAFASNFELAGLGGLESTQTWIAKNSEIIDEVWKKSKEEVGNMLLSDEDKKGLNGFDALRARRDFCPQPFSFSQKKSPSLISVREEIIKDYKQNGQEYVLKKLVNGGYDALLRKVKQEVLHDQGN